MVWLTSLFRIVLIFIMSVILSLVRLFLWEIIQDRSFSGYRLKNMVFWEKGFIFVFSKKVIRLWTPSRVIWIKFGRGRPPDEAESRE